MHVAIIGPGALGRLFAAALVRAKANVTLIARRADASHTSYRVARQSLGARPRSVSVELTSELVEADAYLITIRGEQLLTDSGRQLMQQLRQRDKPVVLLSPALSQGVEQLQELLPQMILTLPAIAARWHPETNELHYWSSAFARTRVERGHPFAPWLAKKLSEGGVPCSLALNVAKLSTATTIAFFPLQVALAAVNQLLDWPHHPQLLQTLGAALRQCRRVAKQQGPIEPGIALLTWLASAGWLMRLGCVLLPALLPKLTEFLQFHFGPKLLQQHQLFTAQIEELARQQHTSVEQLRSLMNQAEQAKE